MIKFVEVKQIRDFNVMERRASVRFELDEVWINPDSILQIRPDLSMKRNLDSGHLPSDMDARQEFSKINFGSGSSMSSVTVVGPPEIIAEKIFSSSEKKSILHG